MKKLNDIQKTFIDWILLANDNDSSVLNGVLDNYTYGILITVQSRGSYTDNEAHSINRFFGERMLKPDKAFVSHYWKKKLQSMEKNSTETES